MNKARLLLIILLSSILWYGLVALIFYDHNRWAREFDFFQGMLEGRDIFNDQRRPSFWKRGLDFFMNDYRRRPQPRPSSGRNRPWWQPEYPRELKQRVAHYLHRFGGKLPFNPDLNLSSIQDSLVAMIEKLDRREKAEFRQWLQDYQADPAGIDDRHSLLFLMAGVSAYRNYDYPLARQILNQGLQSTSQPEIKAKFYQNLGFIEHELLNLNQAEQYFTQCLQTDPDNVSYLINIGWNCFLKKEFARCLDYNSRAKAIDSSNWVPHFNIAISHLAMGQYLQAYQNYKRLTEGDLGENAFFYILEDLFTLQKMEPHLAIIDFFIGYTYLNRQMFNQAAGYFETFLSRSAPYPVPITREAQSYLNQIRKGHP
ncbi:MAG: hypothetical protein KBA26_13885 [Candidatus Delongbacteria bacterium]|nr:hypothetical protein [Candidatus Delongbacteria bacterium]